MDIRMKEKSFLQLQAYDSIKNGILNGELEPGQLYSETKLSAKIGISRTPMRDKHGDDDKTHKENEAGQHEQVAVDILPPL